MPVSAARLSRLVCTNSSSSSESSSLVKENRRASRLDRASSSYFFLLAASSFSLLSTASQLFFVFLSSSSSATSYISSPTFVFKVFSVFIFVCVGSFYEVIFAVDFDPSSLSCLSCFSVS